MYTPCVSEIAGNIAMNCTNKLVGGYTGRAVYIPYSANPTLTFVTGNPNALEGITVPTGSKVCAIDNVFTDPFTGSTTAGTSDNGFPQYTKTLSVRIPLRGGVVSRDIVEPLFNSPLGGLLIVEKKDRSGVGSYEVIGANQPARADITTLSRDESANGGAWTVNIIATENLAEVELLLGDYTAEKQYFEKLLAQSF